MIEILNTDGNVLYTHPDHIRYWRCDLRDLDLRFALLTNKDLRSTSFVGSDLRFANLSGSDLSYANLSHCLMGGAVLTGCNLTGTNFTDAIYTTTLVLPPGPTGPTGPAGATGPAVGGLQAGTCSLIAGTATVVATITANSRVLHGRTSVGGNVNTTVEYAVASKTVGAPGSFVIRAALNTGAINAADQSTLDWVVVG